MNVGPTGWVRCRVVGSACLHDAAQSSVAGLVVADLQPERFEQAPGDLLEEFGGFGTTSAAGWSRTLTRMLRYRDRQRAEVDVIIEPPDDRAAGFEIKSGTDIGHRGVHHLAKLQDRFG